MKKMTFLQFAKIFAIYLVLSLGIEFLFVQVGLDLENPWINAAASMLPLGFLLYSFEFIFRPPSGEPTRQEKVMTFVKNTILAFVIIAILNLIIGNVF